MMARARHAARNNLAVVVIGDVGKAGAFGEDDMQHAAAVAVLDGRGDGLSHHAQQLAGRGGGGGDGRSTPASVTPMVDLTMDSSRSSLDLK